MENFPVHGLKKTGSGPSAWLKTLPWAHPHNIPSVVHDAPLASMGGGLAIQTSNL